MKTLAIAGVAMLGLAGPALGQTCIGIETRVIAQTLQLDAAVGGQISLTQGAMLTLDQFLRGQLLSALKVMTRQQSSSTDQQILAEQKSSEAASAALSSQALAYEVEDAKDRYQATGFGACAVTTKATSFYDAVNKSAATQKAIAGKAPWQPAKYGKLDDWLKGPASNGPFDASALFNGDEAAAGGYIGLVMGPPDVDPALTPGTSAEAGGMRLAKANRDALKSTAQVVMAKVAADNAKDGPVEKLRDMTSHWLAQDGGEAWAASMAAAPERGILQDAVRLEAAHLVALAFSLKANTRQEAATAALLLARINNAIGGAGQ